MAMSKTKTQSKALPAPKAARKASLKEAVSRDDSQALQRRQDARVANHRTDDEEEGLAVVPAGQRIWTSTPKMDKSDLIFPRLKLLQSKSPEVEEGIAEQGQFIILGHDPVDSVILVPCVWGKGRILSTLSEGILCQSGDAITGEGDPGGSCARCSLKEFTKDRKGNSVKPECTFFYSYGFWSETHNCPLTFDFKSTGLNAGRELNTIVDQKGPGSMGTFAIELTSTEKSGKVGSWAVPTLKVVKADPKTLKAAQQAFNL
jgi:hypothetical protein